MTTEEFAGYYRPAVYNFLKLGLVRVSDNADQYRPYRDMERLLGYPIFSTWQGQTAELDKPMDAATKNLLGLLVGPHAVTILKAYQAKKGIKND